MSKNTDATRSSKTLSEQVAIAVGSGYFENFNINEKGLHLEKSYTSYNPRQVKIDNFYRFEGYNDPQDSSILYLITTVDGKKGTLVDAYGVYADEQISSFIRAIESIHKNIER